MLALKVFLLIVLVEVSFLIIKKAFFEKKIVDVYAIKSIETKDLYSLLAYVKKLASMSHFDTKHKPVYNKKYDWEASIRSHMEWGSEQYNNLVKIHCDYCSNLFSQISIAYASGTVVYGYVFLPGYQRKLRKIKKEILKEIGERTPSDEINLDLLDQEIKQLEMECENVSAA